MSTRWQIPRNGLAWLLLSQLAVIAPHAPRLPVWVLGAFAVSVLWRLMVFQGRWSFPDRLAKAALMLACFVGIYVSYDSYLGLEPTVALLISGFSLKLIEAVSKRDVYIIIFLAYFVCLTEFLFSQDFLITVYMFASVLLTTSALIALHQHQYYQFNYRALKKSGLIFAQAIPLMLVLFIIFPRFTPLWSVPLPSHQAKTGMSAEMSPGDISQLSQSSDLAFRAVFEGDIPANNLLYWRGVVLSLFDGRRWSQNSRYLAPLNQGDENLLKNSTSKKITYSIIQEPTYRPWLFGLSMVDSRDQSISITSDYRLLRKGEVYERIKYDVVSDINAKLELVISASRFRTETLLPQRGNEQSKALAKKMLQESSDSKDYINTVLKYFREESFVYTLKPPLLGENSIDDFLFDSRRGFCEHYASSFVFLMRAANIPARVVTGYQGGEINPITKTVLVHQFDAHAWAEVWLEGEGWIRVDPTAAVSPDRIERGMDEALFSEGSFLAGSPLSTARYRRIAWLNKIRMQLDAYNYYWVTTVLKYRGETQSNFLKRLLGEVDPWRIGGLLLSVGVFVGFIVAYSLFKERWKKRVDPAVSAYLKMCAQLEKQGHHRPPYEGAITFARRISEAERGLSVENKKHLLAATKAFVTISYKPIPKQKKSSLLKLLHNEIAQLRP
jgi:transglutaminase-like putative cysteine protease